ncbi:MAG: MFS transporter [Deltaproteobacteria bacterium]|nr:MFS transporter [Deltaproteobacteria bacterium]
MNNQVAKSTKGRRGNNGCDGAAPLFRSQAGPILLLTGIFSLNFMARIILSPLMPTIEGDLQVDHSQAGGLFLLTSLGYFVALLGAGFLSSRITHRRTILLSSAAVGITLLAVSFSNGLLGMRLGFLFLGVASGFYLPSGIATLTTSIRPADWGKGLGIHELAPNFSFVAAPLVCECLLPWVGWRGILALLGGASILAGAAFAFFGRGGDFPGEAPNFTSFKTFLVEPAFWIMAILFSLAISGSMGIFAMLPLYLVVEQGIDRNWANTLVALSRISGLGMGFVAGWATDRFGPRGILSVIFLLTGVSTILLGTAPKSWIVFLVFLQPMLAVTFFPPGFVALSAIGPPGARNVAVSLTIPLAFLFGGGVIPAAIGVMGDYGSFALGIALVGGVIAMGFILSLRLKLPQI